MSKTKVTKAKLKVAKQSANHQKVIKPTATEEKNDAVQKVTNENKTAKQEKHKFNFVEFMKSFSFTDKPAPSKPASSKKSNDKAKTIKPIKKKEEKVVEDAIEKTVLSNDSLETTVLNENKEEVVVQEMFLTEEVKESAELNENDDAANQDTTEINDDNEYEVTKDIEEYLDKVEEINEDYEDEEDLVEETTIETTAKESEPELDNEEVISDNPDGSIYVDFDEELLDDEDSDDDYEPAPTKEKKKLNFSKVKDFFGGLKSKITNIMPKKKESSKIDELLDSQNEEDIEEINDSTDAIEQIDTNVITEELKPETYEVSEEVSENESVLEHVVEDKQGEDVSCENEEAPEENIEVIDENEQASEENIAGEEIVKSDNEVVEDTSVKEEKKTEEVATSGDKQSAEVKEGKSGLSKIISSLNIEVSKPKLGSYKLVFDVTNIDDIIYLELECLDIDFTGFKVKSIDTIYSKTINLDSKSYETDVYLMTSEIKDLLKKMEINKSVNILNYCSNLMFFENITLPKLSSSEALKSVKMNLVKLYPEFKRRYVYDILKSPIDTHSNLYTIAMVDIEKYRKVIDWFKTLKLNLNYVSLSSDSIRRLLVKNALLPRRHSALIINMKENHTEILSYDGRKVEGMRVAKEGYKRFATEVSSQNRRRYEFILNELKEGSMLEKFIVKRDRRNFVRKALPGVTLECKRIIGEVLLHHNIDNVYLNIEGIDTTLIADCLSRYLKCKVNPFNTKDQKIINHLSSYGASIKTKGTLDFEYPVKLKN